MTKLIISLIIISPYVEEVINVILYSARNFVINWQSVGLTVTICWSFIFRQKHFVEKNLHNKSWELSFIWGRRKTASWETVIQIALRNST